MIVDKLIELPSGAVKFQGELTVEETEYVVTLGLSMLLMNGALPYVIQEDGEASLQTGSTETVQ